VTLSPVRRKSVSEAAYEQICDAIVSGELAPGALLPSERALAGELQVNRGAVREALKRLEQSGLILIHHGGSTRVLDFRESARLDLISRLLKTPEGEVDLKVTRSVIELRNAITPDIARLAALRGGPKIVDELDAVLSEMRGVEDDAAQLQELGQEFMKTLVRAADNVAYRLVYNTVEEVHLRYRDVLLEILEDRYRDFSELENIADAVRRGEPDAAMRAAQRYASAFAGSLFKQITELGSSAVTR
jgi:GntR family transcriptional repressor for pyruvate dehydrogenase complex